MTHAFWKMHGLGNDFVVLDVRNRPLAIGEVQARALADRRTGIGFDQLLLIERDENGADAFLRIRNSDGSEVAACGNGSRAVARLLLEETGKDRVVIGTAAGPIHASRAGPDAVSVDMGPARLDWREIPLARAMDTLRLDFAMGPLEAPVAVSMGNPHAVFFVPDAEAVDLETWGPKIETDPLFPARTNVEAVHLLGPDRLRMRVWERGTGITRACGTGACAAGVAAARRGLTGREVDVVLDGGTLGILWRADGHVVMTGPAALSYTGTLADDLAAVAGL
ncbi:MAG TPA: diaminopimelate epimerase [Azospirillaceae bacterium]|nr:diaminopimelate epimerase [Azospirillaceae bacterium]